MKLLKGLVAGLVATTSLPMLAYETGDLIVKAGPISVMPSDNNANTSPVTSLLTSTDDSSELDVNDNNQLGITLTYMATDHIGVELLAATPFEHAAEIKGGALDGTDIIKTKQLPPTLSAQYYFLDSASPLQLYAGLGLNYTIFFDEEDSQDLGIRGLKNSWGLAYSAGLDYQLDESWSIIGSIWKIDIDTEVEGSAADGLEVEIDPTVVMLGAGYQF
jgi:outer membrane protein